MNSITLMGIGPILSIIGILVMIFKGTSKLSAGLLLGGVVMFLYGNMTFTPEDAVELAQAAGVETFLEYCKENKSQYMEEMEQTINEEEDERAKKFLRDIHYSVLKDC
jgi:hypothetical protein